MIVINKPITLLIPFFVWLLFIQPSYAGGIGYVNYDKVLSEYQYAKTTMRDVENKNLEIRKYLEQKEIEFAKLETPLQKQKFEASVKQELKVKERALNDFKTKREESVYKRIHAVSEKIRVDKNLDAILDIRSVFSGGVDITEEMIKTLNTGGGIREGANESGDNK